MPELNRNELEAVERVRAYPWPEAVSLADADDVRDALRDGAVALLAYGSNGSPSIVARKLGAPVEELTDQGLLVVNVVVLDADIVFSAHVSPHGAVPVTIVQAPGTVVEVRALTLPPAALAPIDASEPNYVREPRRGVKLDGEPLGAVDAYVSRHGPVQVDGRPAALRGVPARGRRWPELSERDLLERMRARMAPGDDPDEFVLEQIREPATRRARTRLLKAGL